MMRFLIFLMMCLLFIKPAPAYAESEFERLAGAIPVDVDFFAVTRIDSDFISRLDGLLATVNTYLPNALSQPISVNGIINQIIMSSAPLPIELNFVQLFDEIFGDWVAIGVDGLTEFITNSNSDWAVYLVFDIENYESAQNALSLLINILQLEIRNPIADYDIYSKDNLRIALSPHSLYVSVNTDPPIYNTNKLSTSLEFSEAVNQLPETNYDIWSYFNATDIFLPMHQNSVIREVLESFQVTTDTTGVTVLGIKLEESWLAIDLVQHFDIPQARIYRPISSSFWRFIPPQAQFFIHTTDFANFFETTLSILAPVISASETPETLMRDLSAFSQLLLNADLENDILSWNTGDFAFWGRLLNEQDNLNSLYLGWVFRTTSLGKSQQLVNLLSEAAQSHWGSLNVNRIHVNNTDVIFITLPSELNGFLSEIALGANDDIFFIATPAAAQDLLTRHDGYLWAIPRLMPTFLESPKVAMYLNGGAIGEIGVVLTTLLEPVELFLFREPLSPEMLQAYRTAFAQLFPALSLSAKASEQGDVIIRLVAQIKAVSEGDIPGE